MKNLKEISNKSVLRSFEIFVYDENYKEKILLIDNF